MSPTRPVSCISDAFYFIVYFAFIFAVVRRIRFLRQWVWQTWVWLQILWYVIFSHFFFVFWRLRCWCFGVWYFRTNRSQVQRWYLCVWHFCTNRSWFQRCLTPCILLALKLLIFFLNLKISFIVIAWLYAHSVSNFCSFSQKLIQRAPIVNICRPSNYGSEVPETGSFIRWLNGREPQINELLYHAIDGICRKVHPYAHTEITAGTVGYFFTDHIIVKRAAQENYWWSFHQWECPIYRNIWDLGLPFIPNPRAPDCFNGRVINGGPNSNENPGAIIVNGIRGGSFAKSTVNWSGNCNGPVNSSSADSPRSPICPHFTQSRIYKYFLHLRR